MEPIVIFGNGIKIDTPVCIGSIGFGFEKGDPNSTTLNDFKIPLTRKKHIFTVIIEDNVEIGAFTVIDRGSWRDTVVGRGTKIDSHVKIAHNVQIGENCLIVAGAVIGGSVTMGSGCFIGINAAIKQRVVIGDNAVVGMGSVVTKDVHANTTVIGNPAHEY
jgi:UDP-3-O-[3-hydroxymyristoyl] glucosamine N-acyltransferase